MPFGKYCLSRRLVFSLEPRCHGLIGSQKYNLIRVSVARKDYAEHVKFMYFAIVTWIKPLWHSQNYPFASIGQHDHFSGIFVKSNPLDFPRAPKLTEGVLVGYILSSILDICDKTPQIVHFMILGIAVIGLATQDTPQTTIPTNVADLRFTDVVAAVEEVLPEVQAAEPHVVALVAHLTGL